MRKGFGLGSFVVVIVSLAACGGAARWTQAMAGHASSAGPSDGSQTSATRVLDLPDKRDCNDNALDGLETDVRSNRKHCGSCDAWCWGRCLQGTCEFPPDAGPDAGSLDAGKARTATGWE